MYKGSYNCNSIYNHILGAHRVSSARTKLVVYIGDYMTLSRERSTTFDWELQEVQWATGYTCHATGVWYIWQKGQKNRMKTKIAWTVRSF